MNPFDLGPHAGFILVSYLLTFGVIAGLILWVLIDRTRQTAALKELADQGISRASAPSAAEHPGSS